MQIRIVCNGCGRQGPIEDFNKEVGFVVCECGNPASFRIFFDPEQEPLPTIEEKYKDVIKDG